MTRWCGVHVSSGVSLDDEVHVTILDFANDDEVITADLADLMLSVSKLRLG